MEISIDNAKKCLNDHLHLDESTFRQKKGGGLNRDPKEIRYEIAKRLDLVIRWDYPYGIDQVGGALVSIETNQNYTLDKISWPSSHELSIDELVLAAKKLVLGLTANLVKRSKIKYQVMNNGKSADETGFPEYRNRGWTTSIFSSLVEANHHVNKWLGAFAPEFDMELDEEYDYSGHGDTIKIVTI